MSEKKITVQSYVSKDKFGRLIWVGQHQRIVPVRKKKFRGKKPEKIRKTVPHRRYEDEV